MEPPALPAPSPRSRTTPQARRFALGSQAVGPNGGGETPEELGSLIDDPDAGHLGRSHSTPALTRVTRQISATSLSLATVAIAKLLIPKEVNFHT